MQYDFYWQVVDPPRTNELQLAIGWNQTFHLGLWVLNWMNMEDEFFLDIMGVVC